MRRATRFLAVILCAVGFCWGASSCWFWGGFNQIMYDYFKKESNYREWTMTVSDFVWVYWENDRKTYSLYADSENHEYKPLEKREDAYIYLLLYASETDKAYWGEAKEAIAFELVYENAQEIIANGILENIRIGADVTIRATDWTYSDTRFLYIAALESDGVCYLDMQTGLENMIVYMDENRSLL